MSALKSSNQQQQKKQTKAVNFCESVCTPWSRRVSKRIRLFFFFSLSQKRACETVWARLFFAFGQSAQALFRGGHEWCLPAKQRFNRAHSQRHDGQATFFFFFFPSSWWNGKKKHLFFLACRRLSTPLLGDLDIQFEFPQHALTVFQQTPTHFHEPQYCFCLFLYFFFFWALKELNSHPHTHKKKRKKAI